MKWTRSWNGSRGATLVEALAGLVILSTLLVSSVLARVRLEEQEARAERTLRALKVSEELLSTLWLDPAGIPREDEGRVDGRPGYRYRTRVVDSEGARRLGAEVVRLEIYESGRDSVSLSLDLLLPGRIPEALGEETRR